MAAVHRLLAAIAVCAPAAFAPHAFAQAASPGDWRGVGLQAGPSGAESTWQIRMTIKATGDSAIEYPDLGCKGVLRPTVRSEFVEQITQGDCITNGRIVVIEREGRVFWFWYRPNVDGPDASAVLYRDTPIS